MSVITLEVASDTSTIELCPDGSSSDAASSHATEPDTQHEAGLPFLTDKNRSGGNADSEYSDDIKDQETASDSFNTRSDLLEYVMRTDGSVVCKLCGEILQSRTHWYRHKYKRHVIQPLHPAPLYQCDLCLVFFKSRKGYIGHLASRHGEAGAEPSPVAPKVEVEDAEKSWPLEPPEPPREPDPEPVPKKAPVQQTTHKPPTKNTETKKSNKGVKDHQSKEDWEERRYQEEKLVADIIDRVKRECEAQGSGGGTRRGYTRRTTVMHS